LGEAATKIAAAIHPYVPDRRFLKHLPAPCVLGTCKVCGISNTFGEMNGGNPIPFTSEFDDKELYCACPVEATNDPMSWNKWCKVPTGLDEFNDIQYLEQWAPYSGTRRQFLYELQAAHEKYVEHKHHVRTFNWAWKRAEQKLLVEHGLTGKVPHAGVYGRSAGKVPAMGGCDWASTVYHQRAFTMTCAYPERSQLFVVAVPRSPYMEKVGDIPDLHKRQRKALRKKGIYQKLQYKVAVLYAHHKRKPTAAIAGQICADFMKV
jgi:hypothetical protein